RAQLRRRLADADRAGRAADARQGQRAAAQARPAQRRHGSARDADALREAVPVGALGRLYSGQPRAVAHRAARLRRPRRVDEAELLRRHARTGSTRSPMRTTPPPTTRAVMPARPRAAL